MPVVTVPALCDGPDCSHLVDDIGLCPSCLDAFRARLREIPELLGELLITTTRQAVAPAGPGGRSSEPALIYQPDAAEAGRDLHAVLVRLVDAVRDQLGLTWADIDPAGLTQAGIATYPAPARVNTRSAAFPDNNSLELARWLDRHPDALRGHPDAGQLLDELTDAVARCWYAVDRPDQTRRFLGSCEICTPTSLAAQGLGEWASELWAREDAAWTTCRGCGTVHDVAARRNAMLKRAEGLLVSAKTLTRALPLLVAGRIELTGDTIRGWVRDRGLRQHPPLASAPHAGARYRLGDVLDQIGAARQRVADRARPPVDRLEPAVASLFDQARRRAARDGNR